MSLLRRTFLKIAGGVLLGFHAQLPLLSTTPAALKAKHGYQITRTVTGEFFVPKGGPSGPVTDVKELWTVTKLEPHVSGTHDELIDMGTGKTWQEAMHNAGCDEATILAEYERRCEIDDDIRRIERKDARLREMRAEGLDGHEAALKLFEESQSSGYRLKTWERTEQEGPHEPHTELRETTGLSPTKQKTKEALAGGRNVAFVEYSMVLPRRRA